MRSSYIYFLLFVLCSLSNCKERSSIQVVTVKDFSEFIEATNYKTDAEKYGWSIIQEDIHSFRTISGADWRIPNAKDTALWDFPVTQVSYNDAINYCDWAGVRLPTYTEY